jgi:hypothetical protein
VVHASKLIEFEVQGSCGSWLEVRDSCRARGYEARGSGLLGFGIQGSCGACFKAHRVRGSRLVWFMARGSGFMSSSGLGGSGLVGLGARGVRDSK